MMVVQFVASDMLDHIAKDEELGAMQKVASEVLGQRASHIDVRNMVKNLKDVLDIHGSGSIDRKEAMAMIGEVKRKSLWF
jgi:vacuolar-type H+-ATPase subunit E/Vma4